MKTLNENFLQRFTELISKKTGLRIRSQDIETLRKVILARTKFHALPSPEEYYQLLVSNTDESKLEQQELIGLLTVGESYFSRDKGQFELLKNTILPELIDRHKEDRTLRIWSAGCSTGEEPYSLAILIDEILPHWDDWNILILGTDINEESLGKARRGIYTQWSFRMVNPGISERYFMKQRDEWKIHKSIRTMVEFSPGNLLQDAFPNQVSKIHSMDIILCRNVFIYFNDEAISNIIEKFTNTLNEGGYLMTGHSELYAQKLRRLQTIMFKESAVYKKISESELQIAKLIPIHYRLGEVQKIPLHPPFSKGHVPKPKIEGSVVPNLQSELEKLFLTGDYMAVIEKAKSIIKNDPVNIDAHYLVAQAYANIGEYDRAAHSCKKAINIDVTAVNPYFLLAHIAEAQGDNEEAKNLLKKALYLVPTFVAAYLELGALYEREYDDVRARKMRTTAMELLAALSSDKAIEPYKEVTAGELLKYIKKMLDFTEEK